MAWCQWEQNTQDFPRTLESSSARHGPQVPSPQQEVPVLLCWTRSDLVVMQEPLAPPGMRTVAVGPSMHKWSQYQCWACKYCVCVLVCVCVVVNQVAVQRAPLPQVASMGVSKSSTVGLDAARKRCKWVQWVQWVRARLDGSGPSM